MLKGGYSLMSHNHFRVMSQAIRRIGVAEPPPTGGPEVAEWSAGLVNFAGDDAIIAIMFAAAGIEAMFQDALRIAKLQPIDEATKVLGQVLSTVETSKGSTLLKVQVAATVLSGRPIDTGGQLWEDLRLLLRIRDRFVHLKPESLDSRDKIADTLLAKGLSKDYGEAHASFWMRAGTPAVALWAASVAQSLELYFASLVPENDAGYSPLRNLFDPPFRRPEQKTTPAPGEGQPGDGSRD